MKGHLDRLLRRALTAAVERGALPGPAPATIGLEVPGDPSFGDLSSNVALVLAKRAGRPPRVLATELLGQIEDPEGWIESREVAGPGFMNFRFSIDFWRRMLAEASAAGPTFGRGTIGAGRRVQIEFVSANPTGPLHVGHGRGAVIGDAVARLLEAVGFEVEREYYLNDHGRQMALLGRSTWARYQQACGRDVALPEDGYPGEYLRDVAARLRDAEGEKLLALAAVDAEAHCRDFASRLLVEDIREDLERFGVRFDRWVSERALHDEGRMDEALAALPPELLYREGDALFFRSSRFGDEKDRAVIRGSGEPTYFAGDIAHYHQKLTEGFAELVNVLGADHHGYVPRLQAVLAGFGLEPGRLRVLLVQLVNLTRGGVPVRMGKRAGEFVALRDVLDEIGPDAVRFFFLMRKADSAVDVDLDLAKRRTTDNPVFYAQYAHARIASVLRQAAEQGVVIERAPDLAPLGIDEVEPLRVIASYPDVVEAAATALEPHRVVFFALDLAGAFHRYYNQHRILAEDAAVTQARLALARCVQQVLASALTLVGVAAPERM